MPIAGDKYGFIEQNVNLSPDLPGVYALYDGDDLVYYGRAGGDGVTLRSCLLSHLRGNEGPLTQQATHYRREQSVQPAVREMELLQEFVAAHRRPPRCNSKRGLATAGVAGAGRRD